MTTKEEESYMSQPANTPDSMDINNLSPSTHDGDGDSIASNSNSTLNFSFNLSLPNIDHNTHKQTNVNHNELNPQNEHNHSHSHSQNPSNHQNSNFNIRNAINLITNQTPNPSFTITSIPVIPQLPLATAPQFLQIPQQIPFDIVPKSSPKQTTKTHPLRMNEILTFHDPSAPPPSFYNHQNSNNSPIEISDDDDDKEKSAEKEETEQETKENESCYNLRRKHINTKNDEFNDGDNGNDSDYNYIQDIDDNEDEDEDIDIDITRSSKNNHKKHKNKNKNNKISKKKKIVKDRRPEICLPSFEDATWCNTTYFQVECHFCAKDGSNDGMFSDDEAYGDHLKSHYDDPNESDLKWLHCEQCGLESKHRANFISHLSVHTQQKPYHCTIKVFDDIKNEFVLCTMASSTKQNLQTHINNKHYGGKKAVSYGAKPRSSITAKSKSSSRNSRSSKSSKSRKKQRRSKRKHKEMFDSPEEEDIHQKTIESKHEIKKARIEKIDDDREREKELAAVDINIERAIPYFQQFTAIANVVVLKDLASMHPDPIKRAKYQKILIENKHSNLIYDRELGAEIMREAINLN